MLKPAISVLVLTMDPDERLRLLLDSVRAQQVDADVEVILVDSGSRVSLGGLAHEFGATLRGIPTRSFAHGRTRNFAAEISHGDFLVYISQDAIPRDRLWFSNLLAPLVENERVGAVYGRQVPYPESGVDDKFFYQHFYPDVPIRLTWKEGGVSFVDGAFLSDVNAMIRRAVWETIRFSDDIPWAEDKDFAFKALQAGLEVVYEPSAVVTHSHSYSLRTLFKRRFNDGGAYAVVTARHPGLRSKSGGSLRSTVGSAAKYWTAKTRFLLRNHGLTRLPYSFLYDAVGFTAFGLGTLHNRYAKSRSIPGAALA